MPTYQCEEVTPELKAQPAAKALAENPHAQKPSMGTRVGLHAAGYDNRSLCDRIRVTLS